ncbi:hypothetical protein B296_00012416 [Ensete ventricosum]|uniref:Disease resistance N-terminal domain-containing protein n=1 Tax=Ensete ventricosum TaxID=4639 RepID=A0A427AYS5_ENSVE|nr:hypothetical protein B296_00012416 [Ensete ventricosum]
MFIKLSSHPKVEMVTPVRFLRTDQITFGIVELVLNIDILFLRFAVGVLEPTNKIRKRECKIAHRNPWFATAARSGRRISGFDRWVIARVSAKDRAIEAKEMTGPGRGWEQARPRSTNQALDELKDAEGKQAEEKQGRRWLMGDKEAAHDAEDALDEFEYDYDSILSRVDQSDERQRS